MNPVHLLCADIHHRRAQGRLRARGQPAAAQGQVPLALAVALAPALATAPVLQPLVQPQLQPQPQPARPRPQPVPVQPLPLLQQLQPQQVALPAACLVDRVGVPEPGARVLHMRRPCPVTFCRPCRCGMQPLVALTMHEMMHRSRCILMHDSLWRLPVSGCTAVKLHLCKEPSYLQVAHAAAGAEGPAAPPGRPLLQPLRQPLPLPRQPLLQPQRLAAQQPHAAAPARPLARAPQACSQ